MYENSLWKKCVFKCFAWDVANTNSNFAPSGKSIKTRVNNFQKRIEFRKLNTWKVIYLNQSKQLFSWLEYCSLHNNMQLKKILAECSLGFIG